MTLRDPVRSLSVQSARCEPGWDIQTWLLNEIMVLVRALPFYSTARQAPFSLLRSPAFFILLALDTSDTTRIDHDT